MAFWNGLRRALGIETKSVTVSDTLPSGTAGMAYLGTNQLDPLLLIRDRVELSSWVYDCVRLRAESASSVRWYGIEQRSDSETVPLAYNHPLNQLLRHANPQWTFSELVERAQMQLDSTGNAYLTVIRVGGVPKELWLMPPGSIKPVPGNEMFLEGYELNTGGRIQRLGVDDVIHLQYPNPSDPFLGLSPMSAALQAIDLDVRAVEWNRNLVDNRAATETAIIFEDYLDDEQYKAIVERIAEQHQGPQNAGKPWIMDSGASIQSFGATPRDMDWLNSRKFNREEICSIFQVPPPLVGVLDNATYNNIETAQRLFWQNGMVPVLNRWKRQLVRYVAESFGEDIAVEYDVSHVTAMQAATAASVQTAYTLFTMGVPINVANQSLGLGLPEIPGGDIGYIQSGMMPSTVAGENWDTPVEDLNDLEGGSAAEQLEQELNETLIELAGVRAELELKGSGG